VSRKVAQRWVTRYKNYGGVTKEKGKGRPHLLSQEAAEKALHALLEGDARNMTHELQQQGFTTNLSNRRTAIRAAKRVAKQQGRPIHAVRGKLAKRLTEATKSKRLLFCNANKGRGWGNVMFTDRKKFLFSHPGDVVTPCQWVRMGLHRQATTVNHPQCVNLYAGMTKYGVTKLHVVAGSSQHKTTYTNKRGVLAKNITTTEYMDVLNHTLLPEGRRLFGSRGISHWVLQQDNDPAHRKAGPIIKEWRERHACGVSLLDNWPPNSPDLSPIENLWGIVAAKMDAAGCVSFEEFRRELQRQWEALPQRMLQHMISSVPKRIRECSSRGGDMTPH